KPVLLPWFHPAAYLPELKLPFGSLVTLSDISFFHLTYGIVNCPGCKSHIGDRRPRYAARGGHRRSVGDEHIVHFMHLVPLVKYGSPGFFTHAGRAGLVDTGPWNLTSVVGCYVFKAAHFEDLGG